MGEWLDKECLVLVFFPLRPFHLPYWYVYVLDYTVYLPNTYDSEVLKSYY